MDDRQTPDPVEQIAAAALSAAQYRGLCPDTVRRIAAEEWDKRATSRLSGPQATEQAIAATCARLDEMYGAYESPLDYGWAYRVLQEGAAAGTADAIRAACRQILARHVSTAERLPVLDHFYRRVFALTGRPHVLLDLACGLNPLCLPWMGLESGALYYAYDLDVDRVAFLNRCFPLLGVRGRAFGIDLITGVPAERGDVALLLKSSNCLEDQRQGRTLELLDALRVRHIVATFSPPSAGDRPAPARRPYNETFAELMATRPWPVRRLDLEAELVFVVTKTDSS